MSVPGYHLHLGVMMMMMINSDSKNDRDDDPDPDPDPDPDDDDDDDAVVSCKTIPYHVTFHARIFECNDFTCHVSVMTMLVHSCSCIFVDAMAYFEPPASTAKFFMSWSLPCSNDNVCFLIFFMPSLHDLSFVSKNARSLSIFFGGERLCETCFHPTATGSGNRMGDI